MSAAPAVVRAELVERAGQFPARTFALWGGALAALGGAAVRGAQGGGEGARGWQSWHVNFVFWTGLAQGLVVFAAIQKIAKGHWSGLLIRFAEAGAAFLVVSLGLYLGLVLGRGHIFSWLHEPRPDLGPWLTGRTFFIRNGVIYLLLTWLSWRFVRHDVVPDIRELADDRPAERLENRDAITRDAAVLVVAYTFGYSLLAFDLMMSLAPKWVSNLFGAFYFMGSFLAALMTLAVLTLALRRRLGLETLVSRKQPHDLGQLRFGFTAVWAHPVWAADLVISYGNLPDETFFI